jgi:hypothetical protein
VGALSVNAARRTAEQCDAVVAPKITDDHTEAVTAKSITHSVLEWLRAGYPNGVPGPDRVPLLALLRNTPLSEDEVKSIVSEIADEESHAPPAHQIDKDEIERFIEEHTHHDAGPENLRRVAAKLAAAGWPLAGVDSALPQ